MENRPTIDNDCDPTDEEITPPEDGLLDADVDPEEK